MGADDIGSGRWGLENQLLRGAYSRGQPVIGGVLKRGKRTQDNVCDLLRFHIACYLLQALAPVHVGIVQDVRPSLRTTGQFIKVRNVIRITGHCSADLPDQQATQCSPAQPVIPKEWHDTADPYIDERKYRQQVTNSELVGSCRDRDKVEYDRGQQNGLAPPIDKTRQGFDYSN